MKKHALLILAAIIVSISAFAQKKCAFGVHFSPQLNYLVLEDSETLTTPNSFYDEAETGVGLSLGTYGEYAFMERFFVRLGLNYAFAQYRYGAKGFAFGSNYDPQSSIVSEARILIKTQEHRLAVPLEIGTKWHLTNSPWSAMVGVGVRYAFLIREKGTRTLIHDSGPTEKLEHDSNSGSAQNTIAPHIFIGMERVLAKGYTLAAEPFFRFIPHQRLNIDSDFSYEYGLAIRLRFW